MKRIATMLLLSMLIVCFSFIGTILGQGATFSDNFETGTPNADWGLYRANEENVAAVEMTSAPAVLDDGGNYVGYIHDVDGSYNGAAIILAGEPTMQNYSIEGDVYCYVNHAGGSAYTGLTVYGDSTAGVYIKLVADFDSDQRLRLYNNKLDMTTFQYTFDHKFSAADVPGGIPTEDGWHHMKVEVQTVDENTTAFWCYFDGELLDGCPVYDTGVNQMDAGQFGLYAFQMDTDGIAGYFDNIEVKPLGTLFSDDFETGTPSDDWGLYRVNEENVTAVEMTSAPAVLDDGGNYVGYIHDVDGSYNGAAIILAGEPTMQNYSIEGDVYCYVNHAGGSAYTGLTVYGDSTAGVYIKLVADFDSDQRLRLYNNKLDMTTFQYTFDHKFSAADVPGGIPTEDGWHHMKVEVQTVDENTTAFWCYFDGELLDGCPVYDTGVNQMDAGQFGLYAFQMDTDGIAGYFDNIVVSEFDGPSTSVEDITFGDSPTLPKDSRLAQNYPNPFNPVTHISYQVFNSEWIELAIFDMLGRKIRTLVSESQAIGSYQVSWNGKDDMGNKMPTGIYVYSIK